MTENVLYPIHTQPSPIDHLLPSLSQPITLYPNLILKSNKTIPIPYQISQILCIKDYLIYPSNQNLCFIKEDVHSQISLKENIEKIYQENHSVLIIGEKHVFCYDMNEQLLKVLEDRGWFIWREKMSYLGESVWVRGGALVQGEIKVQLEGTVKRGQCMKGKVVIQYENGQIIYVDSEFQKNHIGVWQDFAMNEQYLATFLKDTVQVYHFDTKKIEHIETLPYIQSHIKSVEEALNHYPLIFLEKFFFNTDIEHENVYFKDRINKHIREIIKQKGETFLGNILKSLQVEFSQTNKILAIHCYQNFIIIKRNHFVSIVLPKMPKYQGIDELEMSTYYSFFSEKTLTQIHQKRCQDVYINVLCSLLRQFVHQVLQQAISLKAGLIIKQYQALDYVLKLTPLQNMSNNHSIHYDLLQDLIQRMELTYSENISLDENLKIHQLQMMRFLLYKNNESSNLLMYLAKQNETKILQQYLFLLGSDNIELQYFKLYYLHPNDDFQEIFQTLDWLCQKFKNKEEVCSLYVSKLNISPFEPNKIFYEHLDCSPALLFIHFLLQAFNSHPKMTLILSLYALKLNLNDPSLQASFLHQIFQYQISYLPLQNIQNLYTHMRQLLYLSNKPLPYISQFCDIFLRTQPLSSFQIIEDKEIKRQLLQNLEKKMSLSCKDFLLKYKKSEMTIETFMEQKYINLYYEYYLQEKNHEKLSILAINLLNIVLKGEKVSECNRDFLEKVQFLLGISLSIQQDQQNQFSFQVTKKKDEFFLDNKVNFLYQIDSLIEKSQMTYKKTKMYFLIAKCLSLVNKHQPVPITDQTLIKKLICLKEYDLAIQCALTLKSDMSKMVAYFAFYATQNRAYENQLNLIFKHVKCQELSNFYLKIVFITLKQNLPDAQKIMSFACMENLQKEKLFTLLLQFKDKEVIILNKMLFQCFNEHLQSLKKQIQQNEIQKWDKCSISGYYLDGNMIKMVLGQKPQTEKEKSLHQEIITLLQK